MILWHFHAISVRMYGLRASVHTWKIMLFGSAQWSCEHERHKCGFITWIHEYFPYWKFRLEYFPLGIHATSNFMWIISFLTFIIFWEILRLQVDLENFLWVIWWRPRYVKIFPRSGLSGAHRIMIIQYVFVKIRIILVMF